MKINLKNKDGITLNTAKKYVAEDIEIGLSEEDKLSLVPENIPKGMTILGVVGDAEPSLDTTDATATSYDIREGRSAYVNNEKVEGAIPTYQGQVEGIVVDDTLDTNIKRTMESDYRKKINGFEGKVYEYEQYLEFELKTQEIYRKVLGGN